MTLFCHTWLPCFASYLILPRGFLFLFSVLKAWLRVPGGPLSKKRLCKVSLSIALSLLSVCIRKRKMAAVDAILNLLLSSNENRSEMSSKAYNWKYFKSRSQTPGTVKARISSTDISRRRSRRFSLKTVLAVITTTTPRKLFCVQVQRISRIELILTA